MCRNTIEAASTRYGYKVQRSQWWRIGVAAADAAAVAAVVEEHDLTTLLFKTAVNNSSGQESNGLGINMKKELKKMKNVQQTKRNIYAVQAEK